MPGAGAPRSPQHSDRAGGAESLAGVLAQFPALTQLNLSGNEIGPAGAKSFAGVLAQCPALTHLDLSKNEIGTVAEERLQASWRGEASCFLLEDKDEDDEVEEDEEEEV